MFSRFCCSNNYLSFLIYDPIPANYEIPYVLLINCMFIYLPNSELLLLFLVRDPTCVRIPVIIRCVSGVGGLLVSEMFVHYASIAVYYPREPIQFLPHGQNNFENRINVVRPWVPTVRGRTNRSIKDAGPLFGRSWRRPNVSRSHHENIGINLFRHILLSRQIRDYAFRVSPNSTDKIKFDRFYCKRLLIDELF